MNSLSKKIDIRKIAFTFILLLIITRKYLISFINPSIDIGLVKSLLFYGSILGLLILFITDSKKSVSEIILVGICFILYLLNREGAILLIVLLAVSAKNIDDRYIVKNYLIMTAIFLVGALIIFNVFPWLEHNQEVHYRYMIKIDALVVRMDYGLGNPNAIFYYMVTIYSAYIFLRFKKYNFIDRIILFASAFFIYQTTYSRTGGYTIFAGLIFVEIIRFLDIKNIKPLKLLAKISPILISVISVITGYFFYNNSMVNRLLASRPKYWNVYLAQEGNFLSIFGNHYDSTIKSLNPLDSSYIYIICVLGLLTWVLFMYLLYTGIGGFIEDDKKSYLTVIVIFLIYSFAENLLLEAGLSFAVVLLIKDVIMRDKREIDIYKFIRRQK